LIRHLRQTQNIDAKRIYATGISNGGFFSQRLACDLTDQIAAVASIAATMPETLPLVCKPSRPISVMFMHGSKDPLVHIDGGAILRARGRNISLAAAVPSGINGTKLRRSQQQKIGPIAPATAPLSIATSMKRENKIRKWLCTPLKAEAILGQAAHNMCQYF
jgi:polyhydroxybutyrate depolymerase